MTITQNEIDRFIYLSSNSSYDEGLKDRYRTLGKKILRFIVQELGLKKGEYEIRWNPGGIACSGDHTLHTDKFSLALHDNCGLGFFYWRTVKDRKDYTGGQNQNVHWKELSNGLTPLLKQLKIANDGGWTDPETGDFIMNINLAIQLASRNA